MNEQVDYKAKIRKRNNTYKKARAGHSSLWSKYLSLWKEYVLILRLSKKPPKKCQRLAAENSKRFENIQQKRGATEASSNINKASLLNELFSRNLNHGIQCSEANPAQLLHLQTV